ncbi:MAG: beta-N-acetylhexosaminidase N-terminal domain-containing protein, partial [Bryobacteraceae bacterium]
MLASSVLLAEAPVTPAGLRLMPWPASVAVQPGAVAIDGGFTVFASGAGANDPRVQSAIRRLFKNLDRETGLLLPRVVSQENDATLRIVVEKRDHPPPQRLGDDESYSLEASDGHVTISASKPLGALRGMQTFL